MTKGELIEAVAKATNASTRTAETAINVTFESLAKAIKKENRVQVAGFGTFSVRARKARNVRNPQTGAVITVKASRTVGFKPAPSLKKGL
jgi:DNA-binding protein HU-beta